MCCEVVERAHGMTGVIDSEAVTFFGNESAIISASSMASQETVLDTRAGLPEAGAVWVG